MQSIQFDAVVNGGIIHIPKQYLSYVTAAVKVTLTPVPQTKLKSKTRPSSIEEFPAILNTKGWKFDREEANERR
jgi:hypothetical protein